LRKIALAALALALLSAPAVITPAFAQDHGNSRHDDRRDDRRDDRAERRDDERFHAKAYRGPRGYQQRDWAHGESLPAGYYARGYRVDYRAYRLRAPPAGYHWVRVDHDVLLVRDRGGVIEDIVRGLFY
jgi:Ni/Co efflux regulator RcnB